MFRSLQPWLGFSRDWCFRRALAELYAVLARDWRPAPGQSGRSTTSVEAADHSNIGAGAENLRGGCRPVGVGEIGRAHV